MEKGLIIADDDNLIFDAKVAHDRGELLELIEGSHTHTRRDSDALSKSAAPKLDKQPITKVVTQDTNFQNKINKLVTLNTLGLSFADSRMNHAVPNINPANLIMHGKNLQVSKAVNTQMSRQRFSTLAYDAIDQKVDLTAFQDRT